MSDFKRTGVEYLKFVAGLRYRAQARASESFSEEQFWNFQRERLSLAYDNAKREVAYYRDNPEYPLSLDSKLDTINALRALPVLAKAKVRDSPTSFQRDRPSRLSATHTTGGTTGSPLRVRAGVRERGTTNAVLERRNLTISGHRSPRTIRLSGYIAGHDPDALWLDVPGTRIAYLSIYAFSPQNRSRILAKIRRFRPEMIHGYASALAQLADLCDGETLTEGSLAVVSTSETLDPSTRSRIEAGLTARVYNEYGSQEGQHLVLECSQQSLHIHPMRGVVELLQMESDAPAEEGELGRVVVTGIASREMPLLRYDIGDSALSLAYRAGCGCGLHWPLIGQVYGRTEDLVKMRDGRRIGLLSHSTLKDLDGIRESQVVQISYEEFVYRLRLAPNADRARIELHVQRQLRSRIGDGVSVKFDYITSLERTAAGKIQAVRVLF